LAPRINIDLQKKMLRSRQEVEIQKEDKLDIRDVEIM
jgi:hypothetical protein